MHRIEEVVISNFGPIAQGEFLLDDYTPIVGVNNCGKTTILRALNWVANKTRLEEGDFKDTASPISVAVRVSGIDAEALSELTPLNRQRILPFIEDGEIWYQLTQADPQTTVSKIALGVCRPSNFVAHSESVWENPNGIPEAARAILPAVIYVEAMEDANDEVAKFKQGNTLGKIMGELSDAFSAVHGGEIETAMAVLQASVDANSEVRSAVLTEVDRGTSEALAELFPGLAVRLHMSPPTIKELFQSATFKVQEHGIETFRPFSQLGHGAQRSIQVALLRYLSKIATSGGRGRRILLIDEPELYLHPQAIDVLCAALKRLSTGPYQVVFSTHSPLMVTAADAPSAVLVYRCAQRGVLARPKLRKAVEAATGDAPVQADLLFQISNSRDLLFAKKVLFVEGKTERAVLPQLLAIGLGGPLPSLGIAVIPMGGSGNTTSVMRIVEALGIDAKAVVDLDFALRGGVESGLIDRQSAEVQGLLSILREMAAADEQIHLENGLPAKRKQPLSRAPSEIFEELASRADSAELIAAIHGHLRRQRIWLWQRGAIEKHIGTTEKTTRAWTEVIGLVSAEGYESLPDWHGLDTLGRWLLE